MGAIIEAGIPDCTSKTTWQLPEVDKGAMPRRSEPLNQICGRSSFVAGDLTCWALGGPIEQEPKGVADVSVDMPGDVNHRLSDRPLWTQRCVCPLFVGQCFAQCYKFFLFRLEVAQERRVVVCQSNLLLPHQRRNCSSGGAHER